MQDVVYCFCYGGIEKKMRCDIFYDLFNIGINKGKPCIIIDIKNNLNNIVEITTKEIINKVNKLSTDHNCILILIQGEEPLHCIGIRTLLTQLIKNKYKTYVVTSGDQLFQKVHGRWVYGNLFYIVEVKKISTNEIINKENRLIKGDEIILKTKKNNLHNIHNWLQINPPGTGVKILIKPIKNSEKNSIKEFVKQHPYTRMYI